MIIDEINKLLSDELELIKDIRSSESEYIRMQKSYELKKERLAEKNHKGINKYLAKYKETEEKKAKKEAAKIIGKYSREMTDLEKRYEKKKKKMVNTIFKMLIKEVGDVPT